MRPNSISSSHSAHPSDDDYSSSEEPTRPQRTQERTARLNAQADGILADLPTRRGSNSPRHTNLTRRRALRLLNVLEERAQSSSIPEGQLVDAADYLRDLSRPPEAGGMSDPEPTLTAEQQSFVERMLPADVYGALAPQQRWFIAINYPPQLYQQHLRVGGQIELTGHSCQPSMLYDPDTSQLTPLVDVSYSLLPR